MLKRIRRQIGMDEMENALEEFLGLMEGQQTLRHLQNNLISLSADLHQIQGLYFSGTYGEKKYLNKRKKLIRRMLLVIDQVEKALNRPSFLS